MSCSRVREVDRLFAGPLGRLFGRGLDGAAERELRGHLESCAGCRQRYERHLLLGALSPRAEPAQARLRRGVDFGGAGSRRRLWLGASLSLAAAMALLLVVRAPGSGGFAPRGRALPAAQAELQVFRVAKGGAPERVHDVISAGDEIGFAYRNPGGKQRLLLLARDPRGHVYWYQPAWTDASADPVAIPITGGDELHEIPAVTTQELGAGRLRFIALFVDDARSVKQVEAQLARGVPGAIEVDVDVRVEP